MTLSYLMMNYLRSFVFRDVLREKFMDKFLKLMRTVKEVGNLEIFNMAIKKCFFVE